eukprot:282534-Chlamydomonas_euryale.AAC.1
MLSPPRPQNTLFTRSSCPDVPQLHVVVTAAMVENVLGPPRHGGPPEALERVSGPGAAAGLVWTAVGGAVQYVECARVGGGVPGR